MTTISASSTIGIQLTSPSYTNPIVIDPGVIILSGIDVDSVFSFTGPWTIQNAGSISANATSGAGIFLTAGGYITNQSSGMISGEVGVVGNITPVTVVNAGSITGNATSGGSGISLESASNVTNQSSGTISGYRAIDDYTAALTVVNYGSILGNSTSAGGNGVVLSEGGSVTNQSGGVISGGRAIEAFSATTVVNAGSIAGGFFGIDLLSGGLVRNTSSAAITSGRYGIVISGAAGSLVNDGNIAGNTTASTGKGVDLSSGGNVTNQSNSTISGYMGIYDGAGSTATVVNAGVIAGLGTSSNGVGFGIELMGGGMVSNVTTGTISAVQRAGILITGAAGAVFNAGIIVNSSSVRSALAIEHGGYLSNATTGTISSPGVAGAYFSGGAGTLINAGQIVASGSSTTVTSGVALFAGGYLSNATTGTISSTGSGNAVRVQAAAGTVVNAGTLMNSFVSRSALALQVGGVVTNVAGGLIQGGAWNGIYGTGGAVTIFNAGIITGSASTSTGAGVSISGAGAVTNQSGGSITGAGYGVRISNGAGTVTNAGTIGGTIGAVQFATGQSNRLVVDPGAKFSGTVDGGNTIGAIAVSTLELASAASAGTLSGLGTQFINFGSITFDTGAGWFVEGSTSGLAGTITGFAQGDTIELDGITATGSSYAGGVLTLTETSGSATLNLPGTFTSSQFVVTNVAGGAEVSLACFTAGTQIETVDGPRPVESLSPGDNVVALLGGPGTIFWVGSRAVDCARHPNPKLVWPIRVVARTFGENLPHRDMWLSPDHAVFVDNVLIPIKHLINGSTIVQVPVDKVTYYHIELEQHDVLRAEGLPTESYLDVGDRSNFANGGGPVRLHPDFSVRLWESMGCAPLIVTGPKLSAVRQRLEARMVVLERQNAARRNVGRAS